MSDTIRYWQHRVNYEGGLDILRTSRRLTIGFSDIAADDESCQALKLADWGRYCQRYTLIYQGKIPRNKAVLWRFVVEMSIGDIVVVPVPCGFQIFKITSEVHRIENPVCDLGWYRCVEEVAPECTPREAYASQLVSAMRCQKTNIEITRLASEVEQAIERRNSETNLSIENATQRPYRMGAPDEIAREMINGVLNIPDVQRGYVWNATQVELLWDSILRQIPIGTFSVRPKRKNGDVELQHNQIVWDLVDGQQRATSIEIAYHVFPPSVDDYTKETDLSKDEKLHKALSAPLLWIDLRPNCKENTTRKYYFRVTTDAHPWGYKVSTKEKGNDTLEVRCRREFVSGIATWHHKAVSRPLEDVRPYPAELWPKTAKLPIPFQLANRFLHEAIEKDDSPDMTSRIPTFKEFVDFCVLERDRIGNVICNGTTVFVWNWLEHIIADEENIKIIDQDGTFEEWESFARDVLSIKDYVVFQQNALRVDDRDLGVYFKRIGRGGSVPSEREIAYSLLKVRIPDIKFVMDDIAKKGITSAAHMADIAMRVWYSLDKKEPRWNVSNDMLMKICEDEETKQKFRHFVLDDQKHDGSFRSLLSKVDAMLGVGRSNGRRLLHWHRAQFCSEYPASRDLVFQYLLMHADNPESGIDYAGLASFLVYHANHLDRVVKILQGAPSVKEGLVRAYKDSYYSKVSLADPVFLSQLKAFQDAVDSDDWVGSLERAFNSKSEMGAGELLRDGYKDPYKYAILLYATRAFIDDVFPEYDSNNHLWAEENCPWDYDHILPHSWLEEGSALYRWDQNNTGGMILRLVNSLGNLAPLPFSLNRAKSDSAPTTSYPFHSSYKNYEWIERYQRELILSFGNYQYGEIDYDRFQSATISVDDARALCRRIIARMIHIYGSWFSDLAIERLLDFSEIQDSRKVLLSAEIESKAGSGWRLSSGGNEVLCEDQMRTEFNWKVRETIEFSRQYNEQGRASEIVYVDKVNGDNVDSCYIGIRKIAKTRSIDVGCVSNELSAKEFVICKEESSWQAQKKYQARPTIAELDQDIEFLEHILIRGQIVS